LRISFTEADRELPLLMGLRPVLKKAEWQGRDFAAGSLMVPTGSGPYVVDRFEPGRFITFRRNPDYWGRDLAINRGLHNLDEIRYDYFGDGDVAFQAFTAGEITSYRESSAAKWAAQYDFAAVRSGEVVKSEIPHHRPSGMTGLVMNTRNPVLADWRAREALILAFNFEFINQTLNGGLEPRITSYFGNSALAMDAGPATGRVAELLAPFAASLLPGTTEGYTLPRGDPARAIDRGNLRRATALLQEAGWSVTASGRLEDAGGRPFAIDILLPAGATGAQTITDIYVAALASLGITPTITTVDAAQYRERTKDYSFDLTWFTRALSLSPGNEQRLYWGGWGVKEPGSRNLMGMDDPAAEAMIDAMLTAATEADFRAAVQALDRILTAGRYVIPVWHSPVARIAHSAHLHYPARLPLYGDWPGFQPEVWWYRE
jgi:peptide/nickel transport system substrate-binding protein